MQQPETDLTASKRSLFLADIAAGKTTKEAAEIHGVKPSTAFYWAKKAKTPAPETMIVGDDEEVPKGIAPQQISIARGKQKMSSKPLTEATAQQLCAGIFGLIYAITHDPEWPLTKAEKELLGGPLADSLRVLPGNVAGAINSYAAPVVFGSTLVGVIIAKQNAIQRRKSHPRPPQPARTTPFPVQQPPVPQQQQPPVVDQTPAEGFSKAAIAAGIRDLPSGSLLSVPEIAPGEIEGLGEGAPL